MPLDISLESINNQKNYQAINQDLKEKHAKFFQKMIID